MQNVAFSSSSCRFATTKTLPEFGMQQLVQGWMLDDKVRKTKSFTTLLNLGQSTHPVVLSLDLRY